MLNQTELKTLIDQALDAFWAVIAGRFPEARTGDLSPGATIRLDLAAAEAAGEWVANNVPATPNRGGRHE